MKTFDHCDTMLRNLTAQPDSFPPLVLMECPRSSPGTRSSNSTSEISEETPDTTHEYRVSIPTTEYMRPAGWSVVCGAVPSAIAPSEPFAICVRTTVGSFHDYSRESLLHCGITDAHGVVYHFDEGGLHVSAEGWRNCVSVALLPTANHAPSVVCDSDSASRSTSPGLDDPNVIFTAENETRWNSMVRTYHERQAEAKLEYHTTAYNCFNYIVDFLNTGNAGQPVFASLSHAQPMSVAQVASQLIQPRMHTAELYLWLLRQTVLDRADVHREDASDGTERASCSRRSGAAAATSLLRGRFLLYRSEYERTSVPAFSALIS